MARVASPLKGVIVQLQARRARLQDELERVQGALAALTPSAPKPAAAKPKRKKRRMSPEAKKKLSIAAKARWAKIKAKQ